LGERLLDESMYERRWHGDPEPVDDHAVDADESSLGVDERTARIAGSKPYVRHNPARGFGFVTRDGVQDAHRQRVADPKRMPMCENELAGAKGFGIAKLEQRTADRRRCQKCEIMMGMVRECVRFSPLAGGVNL